MYQRKGELKWNVLIVMGSAEHTLNALNAERGIKMNEKSIPQALREQADALEKLAQRIAKESKEFSDVEDLRDGREIADALFAIQSKLRYDYFWIADAMWDT